MDKEHIKKLAENPNFIAGIYNYCDRWCERCHLTCRCMNFALAEEHFGDSHANDINNEAFWQKLSELFQTTLEMVKETAQEQGIDLDYIDHEEIAKQQEQVYKTAKEQPYCQDALSYIKKVDSWFDSNKGLLEDKADELQTLSEADIPGTRPVDEAVSINDCLEVVRWYQHQIHVKLARAVSGTLEETSHPPDDAPKDSDGSAKVALIAIDRSIAAWGRMYEHFPQRKAGILDILLLLDRLRTKTQSSFPNARAFVRPGLDDENQDS